MTLTEALRVLGNIGRSSTDELREASLAFLKAADDLDDAAAKRGPDLLDAARKVRASGVSLGGSKTLDELRKDRE